jgi:hypothetical protein
MLPDAGAGDGEESDEGDAEAGGAAGGAG